MVRISCSRKFYEEFHVCLVWNVFQQIRSFKVFYRSCCGISFHNNFLLTGNVPVNIFILSQLDAAIQISIKVQLQVVIQKVPSDLHHKILSFRNSMELVNKIAGSNGKLKDQDVEVDYVLIGAGTNIHFVKLSPSPNSSRAEIALTSAKTSTTTNPGK